ncbi:hypothetical protein [Neolewinella antarctica]|uniref:Acyloxyacyl hydrolase n=1 Tax=Neolewinella antarctica TaxID=442734 RepID=A0ABX0X9F7_9BACT|nr:hypothetical protein [Neolewinella antarctica]NJC25906.1 hypothetical protein [Neolewinella antarctica]
MKVIATAHIIYSLASRTLLAFFLLLSLSLNGQDEVARPAARALYEYFDEKLPDTLSANKHNFYPVLSGNAASGVNLLMEGPKALVERPRFLSIDFRMGSQTTGRRVYQQLWRYPEWGVGYYGVKLYNDEVFGVPNALFGYIDIPGKTFSPERRWTWGYHIGGGLSFNFQPNNPDFNPLNNVIGSYNNVFIDLGFWASHKLSESIDIRGGFQFIHFSNGASSLPNQGMNMIGPNLQIKHHLVRERPTTFKRDDIPEWTSRHGLFVYQAIGGKQVTSGGKRYFNSTTGLAYKWWSGYRNRWLVQADVFYDSSNNTGEGPRDIVPVADRDNPNNLYSLGIFAGHEAVYNRWGFVVGWGVHVARRYEYTSVHYQRFGVQYRVWNGLVVGAGLKARTFAADYIEWSIGYNAF